MFSQPTISRVHVSSQQMSCMAENRTCSSVLCAAAWFLLPMQELAQQAQVDLSQAVAAVKEQEHAVQEQQVAARVAAHLEGADARHSAELHELRTEQAALMGTAKADHEAQLSAVEADLEQHKAALHQVLVSHSPCKLLCKHIASDRGAVQQLCKHRAYMSASLACNNCHVCLMSPCQICLWHASYTTLGPVTVSHGFESLTVHQSLLHVSIRVTPSQILL